MRQEGKLGDVEPGAFADLLVVDGDPLKNLGLFQDRRPAPVGHHEGRQVPQEHADLSVQPCRSTARRGARALARRAGRWALNGAAAVALAYILLPLIFVMWLAFFRQEIPSFPPEGYSLRWFAAILDQRKFVDGFSLSFQVGVAAPCGRPRARRAGGALPGALQFRGARAARQPAADAADRARRRAGHGDVRLPGRGRDRDSTCRLLGTFYALVAGHVVIVIPWVVRLVTASLAGFDRAIEEAAQNLGANAVGHLLAHHPAGDPARHRGGRAVRLRHLVRQSRDEPVPGRARPHDLPIAILQYLEWKIDPTIAAVSVVQIVLIGVAMLITDRYVKLARVV